MTTTKSKTAEPEVPAEPTAEETAAAAGLPDLRLGSDIAAEASAALAELPQDEAETEDDAKARWAAAGDEMTAEAMRATPGDALDAPLAAELARNGSVVLAPLWSAWQDCRTVTETDIAALLDEWVGHHRGIVHTPLTVYCKTGQPAEPVEDRWRTPATA